MVFPLHPMVELIIDKLYCIKPLDRETLTRKLPCARGFGSTPKGAHLFDPSTLQRTNHEIVHALSHSPRNYPLHESGIFRGADGGREGTLQGVIVVIS